MLETSRFTILPLGQPHLLRASSSCAHCFQAILKSLASLIFHLTIVSEWLLSTKNLQPCQRNNTWDLSSLLFQQMFFDNSFPFRPTEEMLKPCHVFSRDSLTGIKTLSLLLKFRTSTKRVWTRTIATRGMGMQSSIFNSQRGRKKITLNLTNQQNQAKGKHGKINKM